MAKKPVTAMVDPDLFVRIEKARGHEARSSFLDRLIIQALDAGLPREITDE